MRYVYSIILFAFLFYNLSAQEVFINYYEDGGVLEKGSLLNGKLNGEFSSYYKNGELKIIAKYINGFVIEKKEYDSYGNIQESIYMINGSTGFQVYKFDANGRISEQGIIDSKGLKTGEWIYNKPNSVKSKRIIYKDDKSVISH